MNITLAQVEAALNQGLTLISQLAPLASLGGPAAGAIGVTVGAIAGAAEKIVAQVENDATVIAGGDPTAIRALQAQIQAENDKLAAQVDAS